MDKRALDNLGDPDLKLSHLQLWVHGKQFPDSDDFWDGSWLRVTTHCGSNGSSVWVSGSYLRISEIAGWLKSIEEMEKNISGEAVLDCIEPELRINLAISPTGKIEMKVNITPDHMTQVHEYLFEIDQSYMSKLKSECKNIIAKFPTKGSES